LYSISLDRHDLEIDHEDPIRGTFMAYRRESIMKMRWSVVSIVVFGMLAFAPLRPLASVQGQQADAGPAAGAGGRYQMFLDKQKSFTNESLLFDSATGRVWSLDTTNPVNLKWKLVLEGPR
jgi:hypothetical protein